MPEERKKTLKTVYKTAKKGSENYIWACIAKCRRDYGPTSKNYDPVKEADCIRDCRKITAQERNMSVLEIVLSAMVVWISLLWAIDQYRWAKRDRELLNRLMSRDFTDYTAGEAALEEMRKEEKPDMGYPDILPIE